MQDVSLPLMRVCRHEPPLCLPCYLLPRQPDSLTHTRVNAGMKSFRDNPASSLKTNRDSNGMKLDLEG